MTITKTTAPTLSAVDLGDVKSYLRVTHTEDDALLQGYLDAAHDMTEKFLQRTLVTTTYTLILTARELQYEIFLPYPPGIDITSISVADEDGTFSAVSSANYTTIGTDPMQVVEINDGFVDSTGAGIVNAEQALKIVYRAGYGATNDSVPASIREAIRTLVAAMYDDKGTSLPSDVKFDTVKRRAFSVMRSYRHRRF